MIQPTIKELLNEVEYWDNISIEISNWSTAINEIKEWVEIILDWHKLSFWDIPDNISNDFLQEKLEQFSIFLDYVKNQLQDQQSKTNKSITTEMDIDRNFSIISAWTAEILKTVARNIGKVLILLSFNSPNNVNKNMLNDIILYKSTERLKNEINKFKSSIEKKLWEQTNPLISELFRMIENSLENLQPLLESQENYINSQNNIIYN